VTLVIETAADKMLYATSSATVDDLEDNSLGACVRHAIITIFKYLIKSKIKI
jgi:hypothetical protein